MTIELMLITILRLFGLLWIIGGIIVIKNARFSSLIDRAFLHIESGFDATDNPVIDLGRDHWLLVGGVLTFISGAALVAASFLVLVPLTFMVFHQGLYVIRQSQKVETASSEDEAAEAAISKSSRNGAITALAIWIIAMFLYTKSFLDWTAAVIN